MKYRVFLAFALTFCLLTSTFAQNPGLNGLYFKMTMSFGSFQQDHWWFLPDGRYLNNVPAGGLDPAVFEANCQKAPTACGTYTIQGGNLALTPRSGKPSTMPLEQPADGNLKLAGLFAKHVDKFPPNAKLEGQYGWLGNASGGGTSVSAAKTYVFRSDGTFSTSSVGGTTMMNNKLGESTSGAGGGTYKLNGNTLELAAGGQTAKYTVYPYVLRPGDVRLNIDGAMFKRER